MLRPFSNILRDSVIRTIALALVKSVGRSMFNQCNNNEYLYAEQNIRLCVSTLNSLSYSFKTRMISTPKYETKGYKIRIYSLFQTFDCQPEMGVILLYTLNFKYISSSVVNI